MRTNLLTNPSGQRSVAGYVGIGTGTLLLDAGLDTRFTTTGSGAAGARGITIQTLTVGAGLVAAQQYTLSVDVEAITGGPTVGIRATGTGVVGTTVASSSAAADSAMHRVSLTFTAAASGTVNIDLVNTATASAGAVLMFRNALLELGAVVDVYFDGATSGGFWTGTADASTSVFPNSTPVLTVSTDANPAPRVLVVIPEVAPTATTVNVTRVNEGRTFKVRGGVNLFAVGGAQVMDYEPAIGSPNSYRAEMFDASGLSLGFVPAAVVTIDPAAAMGALFKYRAWVSQPLKPSLAVLCAMTLGSAADLQRNTPGDLVFAEGAAVGTRIGGRRQGLSGVAFKLLAANVADADELQSMLGDYTNDFPAVLCIRTAPPMRVPRVFFASVDELHESAIGGATQLVTFDLTADESQPPSPGLVIPTLRRKDIDAAFTTRAARAAAYATRIARDTDYSKAGLGG